jgi:lysozyme family protein
MAEFSESLALILRHEGGYANDPADLGGETFRGIARNFHPEWPGWKLIDAGQREGPELDTLVSDFYRAGFWKFDGITNQELANKLMDQAVNRGFGSAVKLLQHVLGITEDGVFGPQTLAAANAAVNLTSKLRVASVLRRFQRIKQDPSQAKFLQSWVVRDAE